MRNFSITALFLLVFTHLMSQTCRPGMCMIDYRYHDDRFSNPSMDLIKSIRPQILITNTSGSYWGEVNKGIGANPIEYTQLGIEVYGFITGGYEGTKYQNELDNLADNLRRVNGIANDKATGVFLDEVSNYPNSASKAYLMAIHKACKERGLKLIFNPGIYWFNDEWLMQYCDYLMSDEQYDGIRDPTDNEWPHLDRILVIRYHVKNQDSALFISKGAQAHGFGYTYVCWNYINYPSYLPNYNDTFNNKPIPKAPKIMRAGAHLYCEYKWGVQWYSVEKGRIDSAYQNYYTPTEKGEYYVKLSHGRCLSDTSNHVLWDPTGVEEIKNKIAVFPNPTSNGCFNILVENKNQPFMWQVENMNGQLIESGIQFENELYINNLKKGMYIVKVNMEFKTWLEKIIVY